jgi:uncharacterized protein YegL
MSNIVKSYVAIILDKSGSMDTIKNEAINHFNEQLQVLQEESSAPNKVAKKMLQNEDSNAVETYVSFITFNQNVTTLIENDDVNNISEIDSSTYEPGGTTALYDAIGQTIEKFQSYDDINDPNVSVLFTIITDGQENASERFAGDSGRKKVKSQIDELQETGKWTFTFMGANQDVMETAVDGLGIRAGNTMSFDHSSEGMTVASSTHTMSTRAYFSAVRDGNLSVESFYDDGSEEDVEEE